MQRKRSVCLFRIIRTKCFCYINFYEVLTFIFPKKLNRPVVLSKPKHNQVNETKTITKIPKYIKNLPHIANIEIIYDGLSFNFTTIIIILRIFIYLRFPLNINKYFYLYMMYVRQEKGNQNLFNQNLNTQFLPISTVYILKTVSIVICPDYTLFIKPLNLFFSEWNTATPSENLHNH